MLADVVLVVLDAIARSIGNIHVAIRVDCVESADIIGVHLVGHLQTFDIRVDPDHLVVVAADGGHRLTLGETATVDVAISRDELG